MRLSREFSKWGCGSRWERWLIVGRVHDSQRVKGHGLVKGLGQQWLRRILGSYLGRG